MPRPLAESEVSRRPAAALSFAHGEKAARDEPKLDRILNNLAARGMQETGASSVAIGLGSQGAMICRAVAGQPLADPGGPINTESGLTGMAVRRQMSQWCTDTESDARVDVEVCRQLGLRSIIVVPVRSRDTVIGVFAIFSANPDAFALADLNTVKKLAHWAAEAFEAASREAAAESVAIADSDHSGGRQPGGFDSAPSHAIGIKDYLLKARRALVGSLNALIGIFRGRSISHPTSSSDHCGG